MRQILHLALIIASVVADINASTVFARGEGGYSAFRIPGVAGDVVPVPRGRLMRPAAPCSTGGFWLVDGI